MILGTLRGGDNEEGDIVQKPSMKVRVPHTPTCNMHMHFTHTQKYSLF